MSVVILCVLNCEAGFSRQRCTGGVIESMDSGQALMSRLSITPVSASAVTMLDDKLRHGRGRPRHAHEISNPLAGLVIRLQETHCIVVRRRNSVGRKSEYPNQLR